VVAKRERKGVSIKVTKARLMEANPRGTWGSKKKRRFFRLKDSKLVTQ
jgi:hypothetical protein